jgi:hypothetical protein
MVYIEGVYYLGEGAVSAPQLGVHLHGQGGGYGYMLWIYVCVYDPNVYIYA